MSSQSGLSGPGLGSPSLLVSSPLWKAAGGSPRGPAPASGAYVAAVRGGTAVPAPSAPAPASFDALAYHRPWCPWVYGLPVPRDHQAPPDSALHASSSLYASESGWLWLLRQLSMAEENNGSSFSTPTDLNGAGGALVRGATAHHQHPVIRGAGDDESHRMEDVVKGIREALKR